MGHRGPDPKDNRLGHSTNADWTTVVDTPYVEGEKRQLPKLPYREKWHPLVTRWWEQVRIMPHCVLWTETDWIFAEETAYMKQDYLSYEEKKTTAATEIRRREDMMGVTLEARRKLRIRYASADTRRQVPASAAAAIAAGGRGTRVDDRRNRLTG